MSLAMGRQQWILIVLLAMLWGGSYFFFEIALESFRPFTIVLGRVGLAALWLHLLLWLGRVRFPGSPGIWRQFAIMGLLNNVIPFSLIIWGQQFIDSGLAAIINACAPLFTAVLAHFLTRDERLTIGRVAGVSLGIAGVIVLIGPAAGLGSSRQLMGELAALAAALSYAFAAIYGRRFRDFNPMVTATGQVTCAAVLTLPLALLIDRPWLAEPSLQSIGALIGLSVLCTAVAYVIFFRILAAAGATNLLLVTLLIPPSALILGFLFLGERPGPEALAGLGLIALGLLTIDGRPGRRLITFLAGSSAPRG